VKDPPWFLPPPPEWGPMPPTMYTSFFHRPRYPSLSTANYYPLYTREDEYDAHLPASMSRRATYTQQMIYDNYVNTFREHTPEYGGRFAGGDPNVGVSTPSLAPMSAQFGGMSEAHSRTLEAAAANRNNYFPMFSPTFVETGARALRMDSSQFGERAVTYFASSSQPIFKATNAVDDAQE